MALSSFLGLALLGIGPAVVFFITFIARKSFLVLLSFFSCFIWFLSLLLISALFKGFLPLPNKQGPYAAYLVTAVVIQELVRFGVWRLHKHLLAVLADTVRRRGRRFTPLDRVDLAMAWGFGHLACHSLFFFLGLLPLTAEGEGDGTFYVASCPQMSLFLVGALNTAAMGMVLFGAMVAALEGWVARDWGAVAFAPAAHMTAALVTLGNSLNGGCVVVAPVLYALGILSVGYAIWLPQKKLVELDP